MTEGNQAQTRRSVLKRGGTAAAAGLLGVGTLTTAGSAPVAAADDPDVVVSGNAIQVTDTTARLVGWIDSLGGADEITAFFYYGPADEPLDQESPKQTFGGRPYNGTYFVDVTGLDPNTDYAFKAVGIASDGDQDLSDGTGSFTTE